MNIEYNLASYGDIHGNFRLIMQQIKKYNLKDYVIFQVGDFGIGFDSQHKEYKRLMFLNTFLKNKNVILIVIRGNHDDPEYFKGNHIYSNIRLMQDYSVVNFNNKNILLLGGAISVDRIDRVEGKDYWKGEKFNLNKQILSTLDNIDIVISHSSIHGVEPYTQGNILIDYTERDPMLIHEVTIERLDLRDAYDILKIKNNIKYWVNGHYHYSFRNILDDTTFIGFAIDELIDLRF